MKKSVRFYLKNGIDPSKYGFVLKNGSDDNNGYWSLRLPYIQSALCIDCTTGQILSNGSWCSATVEVMCRMAKDDALVVDSLDELRPVLMRLTKEEAEAILKMRGHPEGGIDG